MTTFHGQGSQVYNSHTKEDAVNSVETANLKNSSLNGASFFIIEASQLQTLRQ